MRLSEGYLGPAIIVLTPEGIASKRYAAILELFGHLMISEDGALRLPKLGGYRCAIDGIVVFFSQHRRDSAFLLNGDIKQVTNLDRDQILWVPPREAAT